MAQVVLRIRLIGGNHVDVSYEDAEASDVDAATERAAAILAADSGMLRTRHGDRLVVVYGRGVAAIEVQPLGPVL